jgi:peptidoglycan/LPS O-acetylase OafA/YrhL
LGRQTFKYLLANVSLLNFLQQSLPGVFTENASEVVNGSLWTMKIEMAFYIIFPILYLLSVKNFRWLFVIVLTSVAYRVLLHHTHTTLSYQLPGQLYFFATGMLLYHTSARIRQNKMLMALGILLLIKNSIWGYHIIETAVSFPLILLGLSGLFKHTDTFFKAHDYSFTLYLLHWPIIQAGTHLFFRHAQPLQGIAFVVIMLGASSFLFKKLVEDKAIVWGKRYSLRWLK